MNINSIKESLSVRMSAGFDFYERRPGDYQLIVPICHEDGDMVDIYFQSSPKGEGYIRLCDFGLTLMRLSYTYDISAPTRQRILDNILINNGVGNDGGNLYLDASMGMLYEGVLQFAGCVQKVCSMQYWSRETVRSAFYEDLKDYITTGLARFSPVAEKFPLPNYPISVDWALTHNKRRFYVFGVRGNDKAKNVAIALLEFQKESLSFVSLVVHENMEELGRKESVYLTRNADTQYPILDDFKDRAADDIVRIAA